jgi:hypothetical protein
MKPAVSSSRPSSGPSDSSQKPASSSADPLAKLTPKFFGLRVGLPIAGIWIVAIVVGKLWSFLGAAVITVAAAALVIWVIRFAKKNRAVAQLVQGAQTPEARKEALAKLKTDFKKGDTAAVVARAQLEMQDDPRRALATLETIDLGKAMAPVADEVRAQRAMLHLVLGEPDRARQLVDGIELSRQQQPKSRAMLAGVIGEAWARTGQAKKALDTLNVFDPEDPEYAELKTQLYRAYAFAYAAVQDTKGIRRVLRKLVEINPQLLAGFLVKKVHPLLKKEAEELLKRTGNMPKKFVYRPQ